MYEAVRLPFANCVQRDSRENGRLYEFADPRFAHLAVDPELAGGHHKETFCGNPENIRECYLAELKEAGDVTMRNWEWAWLSDPEDERRGAIKKFGYRLRAKVRN